MTLLHPPTQVLGTSLQTLTIITIPSHLTAMSSVQKEWATAATLSLEVISPCETLNFLVPTGNFWRQPGCRGFVLEPLIFFATDIYKSFFQPQDRRLPPSSQPIFFQLERIAFLDSDIHLHSPNKTPKIPEVCTPSHLTLTTPTLRFNCPTSTLLIMSRRSDTRLLLFQSELSLQFIWKTTFSAELESRSVTMYKVSNGGRIASRQYAYLGTLEEVQRSES